jgi:hypothetical protein
MWTSDILSELPNKLDHGEMLEAAKKHVHNIQDLVVSWAITTNDALTSHDRQTKVYLKLN